MKWLTTLRNSLANVDLRWTMARQSAVDSVRTINSIRAPLGLLQVIHGLLIEKPETWLHIPKGSTKYEEMASDIKDIYCYLPENALFLINAMYRWTLVKVEHRVLPYIFIDKAGCTRLCRIVAGEGAGMLPHLNEAMYKILADHTYAGGERAKCPDMTGFVNPAQLSQAGNTRILDKKWDAGGFKL